MQSNYKKCVELANAIDAKTIQAGIGPVTDLGVDCENVTDAEGNFWANDNSEAFWAKVLLLIPASAGMRIAETGFNPQDFGIDY
jgi:hypothetical protein